MPPLNFTWEVNSGNDLTPLHPDTPKYLDITRDISVATFGAYVWDWLLSIFEEYKMIAEGNVTIPIVVYMVSRILTFTSILGIVIFFTSPVADCQAVMLFVNWCMVPLAATTSYLFLLRIKAIYRGQRVIIGFFTVLWLMVCGSAVLVPLSDHSAHIRITHYCMPTNVKPLGGVYGAVEMADRLLIFVFISWKLTQVHHDARLKAFLEGRGQSIISRVLLTSGQLYYFTTVGINTVNLIFVLSPSTSAVHHIMVIGPHIALENAIACRVFRQLKFDTRRQYIDSVVEDLVIPDHTPYSSEEPKSCGTENRSSTILVPTHLHTPDESGADE